MIEGVKLELLSERRENFVRKFAEKRVISKRFGKRRFRENPPLEYKLRMREKHIYKGGKTVRFEKNPLSYMTRYLNEMNKSNKSIIVRCRQVSKV